MTTLDMSPRAQEAAVSPIEALRESEARFAAIFNASPFAISLSTLPDATVVDVNESFLQLFELVRDEAVGKSSVELGIADAPTRAHVAAEFQRHHRVRGFEVQRVNRRGEQRTLLLDLDEVRIASRPFVLTTARDITTRKRAELALREREAETAAIFDALSEGMVVVDREGNLVRHNPAVGRILGRQPSGEANAKLDLLASLRTADGQLAPLDTLPGLIALHTGRPVRDAEYFIPLEDGRRRWITINARPIRDEAGAVTGAVTTFFDISSSKETEAQLIEADHRKNELIAALSHELRNPLLPIRTSVDVLRRASPGSDAAHRALSIIERQAGQLDRLVDDLLDVATLSYGKVVLQRELLELGELVAHAVEDHRQLFERAGVRLAVELAGEPVWVNADGARVSQALGNLLGNAAKFTGQGGRVAVTVSAGGGEGRVEVRDTGMGIHPSQLAHIFEPFSQGAQAIDRKSGGLGLGLSVARGLVALHGGTLSAQSEGEGKGAVFSMTLPATRPPPDVEADVPASPAAPLRVLVVEDNEDAAESLQMALEFGGHEVTVARTGPDGLARALELEPQVVFCDIGLPGMDGYDVARGIRSAPRMRGAVLVALTGYTRPDDVARAKAAGFDRHVAKPVSLEELERVLTQLVPATA